MMTNERSVVNRLVGFAGRISCDGVYTLPVQPHEGEHFDGGLGVPWYKRPA